MKKYFGFLGILAGAILSFVGGAMVFVALPFWGGAMVFAIEAEASLPELYFKSVNPGYVVEGVNNVGEMFEIARGGGSDGMISLAGVTVRYTNTSGNETILVEFPENSFLAGEEILLRLASSPGSELANLTYKKTLAMNAKLTLWRGEELLDAVCFSGKDGCLPAFDKNRPTTLVRDVLTGDFEHIENYAPVFDAKNYNQKPDEPENKTEFTGVEEGEEGENYNEKPDEELQEVFGQCRSLQFSEILSYYAETQSEQFVELYNAGVEQVLLDGCALKYKNKLYSLSGIIKPEGYFVREAFDFKLTKNPTNIGTLEIIDVDGTVVDRLDYPNGQRKGVSYAMIGYDEKGEELWHTTYALTPGEPNIYQEYKTCEEGKVINEETGNCVKVTEVVEKQCEPGQYLNPLTGRCRKNEIEEEKVCKEGYYFYEPTGRCRRVIENDGAEYSLPNADGKKESSFVAVYAVAGIVLVGVGYVVYEYRREIVKFLKRLKRRKPPK